MFLRFISIASKLLRPNNPGIALGSKSGNSGKASLDLAAPLDSSPTEPRLKIFVLESVCAPCVQNLGQWTNPNTLGQQGGYNQTCPEQSQPTPRSGQNPRECHQIGKVRRVVLQQIKDNDNTTLRIA
jgi:hypothetical protein